MNAVVNPIASKLSEYDFVLVIDASGSMGEEDMNGRSRWAYMQETAEQFAREVNKFDSDGIDVVIFGGKEIDSHSGVTPAKIKDVFASRSPNGTTPLAGALEAALKLAGKSDKKDFIAVFTDGVPDDRAAAAKVIVEASHKQATDDALTILFIQVGKDASAAAYLKSLDDNLTTAKFDIVDAKTLDEVEAFANVTALIEAAING